jgi:hypothetical protein
MALPPERPDHLERLPKMTFQPYSKPPDPARTQCIDHRRMVWMIALVGVLVSPFR